MSNQFATVKQFTGSNVKQKKDDQKGKKWLLTIFFLVTTKLRKGKKLSRNVII